MNDATSADEAPRQSGPDRAEMAASARALLRSHRSASLATTLASGAGWPYASLVTVACDVDGSPITLFSGLSDHTRNLAADSRAALLFEDASHRANPQTGPRLTLLGRLTPDDEPRLRRRFLARHPGAQMYAAFSDFRIFHMTIERVHWVGGFAQARWLTPADVLSDAAGAQVIGEAELSALEHMNAEHGEAIDLYAGRLLGLDGRGWRMIAIDPYGCDLARDDAAFARLPFTHPVTNMRELRTALVELTAAARAAPKPH